MSVWNKDKTERVIRLQQLVETRFGIVKEYENALVFNRKNQYKVTDKDYNILWEYEVR